MTTLRHFTIATILASTLCVPARDVIAQAAASPRPPAVTSARTRLSPPSIGLTYSRTAPVFAADAIPRPVPARAAGDDDDPAYAGYKKAYELILDERWDEARKAFRELTKKYPDSEYRDDAEYWIAYSYRETDYDRAMDLYKKFVKDNKTSAYFDDALADMDQMMARSMAVTLPRHAVGVNLTAPATPAVSVAPDRAPGSA